MAAVRIKFATKEALRDAIEKQMGDANTWDVSAITDMSNLFHMTEFNQDISQWDTSNVTTMEGMFSSCSFNSPLFKNVSNVTNMKNMFKGWMGVTVFNQPLPPEWDVSNVVTMEGMFFQNPTFNQPLVLNTSSLVNCKDMFKLSSYNQPLFLDVSKVDNMEGMFMQSKLNQPLVWNTSSVTTMKNMFKMSQFNQPLEWNVSNVVTMEGMFYASQFNQPLAWDTSSVTTMSHMFEYSKMNQDISKWNVESVTETTNMFSESPMLDKNKPPYFVFAIKEIKKKITIFVDMHGENLKDKLPYELPLHTSLAVRPGTCTFMFKQSTTETLARIKAIEDDYSDKPIVAGNDIYKKKYQPFEVSYFEENAASIMKATPGYSKEDLLALHQERTSPLRGLIHNRRYMIEDDDRAIIMGIFIINAQENENEIKFKYPDRVAIQGDFTPSRSAYIKEDYMELQRRNLLNVEVANAIVPGGFQLESNHEYTNIDHVPTITLLDILLFFKKMGFDYVNIIDDGCRGESIDPQLRSQNSFDEHTRRDLIVTTFPGIGGTRKYKKRYRNLRTRHARKRTRKLK